MLTKFTDKHINDMEIALERTVILDILVRERKNNKISFYDMSQIKKIFRSFCKPTLYRSLGGFESINQRQIRTIKELRSDRPLEKKSVWGFGG
jgi:hypothetical protein